MKTYCANCNELLNKIELRAKQAENAEEWCCYECFGDGPDYTEHGKYIRLVKFVIEVSNYDMGWHPLAKKATELLQELNINENNSSD